jgi:8-oxo-dGTP pyrophosphatase MutT (NUDIX family)
MSNRPTHAQAFLNQLNAQQRQWLLGFGLQARQTPPDNWLAWSGDGVPLGWLSPARAEQLVVLLPGCTVQGKHLLWRTDAQHSLQRSQALQAFLQAQADRGRLEGWRDEYMNFWLAPNTPPLADTPPWLCIERAGFRHLGLMSHAVHVNGFTDDGRLWCGHRAANKATDPGLWDNLSAGGLTAGEDTHTTLRRELWEEAGLTVHKHQRLDWSGAVRTQRAEPQGWHDETLLIFNLGVPSDFQPVNQDGEVQAFLCLEPAEVVSRMQDHQFTQDAVHALCQGLGLNASSH